MKHSSKPWATGPVNIPRNILSLLLSRFLLKHNTKASVYSLFISLLGGMVNHAWDKPEQVAGISIS